MTYKDMDDTSGLDMLSDRDGSYNDPPIMKSDKRGPVSPYPGRPPLLEAYDPQDIIESQKFDEMVDAWFESVAVRVGGLMLMAFGTFVLWLAKDMLYQDPNTIWELARTLWAGCGLALIPGGLFYLLAPNNKVLQQYPTDLFLSYSVIVGIIYACQKLAFMLAPNTVGGL